MLYKHFKKERYFQALAGIQRSPHPCPRRVTAGFRRVCSPLYVHLWVFKKQQNFSQKGSARVWHGVRSATRPSRHPPGTSQSIPGAPRRPDAVHPLCPTPGCSAPPEGRRGEQRAGLERGSKGNSPGEKMPFWSRIHSSFLLTSRDSPSGAAVLKDEPLQLCYAAGLLQRARWAEAAPPTPPFSHQRSTLAPGRPAPAVQKTSEPPA